MPVLEKLYHVCPSLCRPQHQLNEFSLPHKPIKKAHSENHDFIHIFLKQFSNRGIRIYELSEVQVVEQIKA